jgi:putative ABC transport system ATP-binding protein
MVDNMEHPVICRRLSKNYQQGRHVTIPALIDIDLDIPKGDFVCLSGRSGSGKSTLLNLLGGLDTPTTGEVEIDGRRVDKMSKADLADLCLYKIGFVFQAYNLIPVFSAQENVEFVMQLQGVKRKSVLKKHFRYSKKSGWKDLKIVARAIYQVDNNNESPSHALLFLNPV